MWTFVERVSPGVERSQPATWYPAATPASKPASKPAVEPSTEHDAPPDAQHDAPPDAQHDASSTAQSDAWPGAQPVVEELPADFGGFGEKPPAVVMPGQMPASPLARTTAAAATPISPQELLDTLGQVPLSDCFWVLLIASDCTPPILLARHPRPGAAL